jgi:hypothetical protein
MCPEWARVLLRIGGMLAVYCNVAKPTWSPYASCGIQKELSIYNAFAAICVARVMAGLQGSTSFCRAAEIVVNGDEASLVAWCCLRGDFHASQGSSPGHVPQAPYQVIVPWFVLAGLPLVVVMAANDAMS